ncbi:MAG: outer membrane protein assembly factor BamB [Akkermansiaceae bacterium]|jgi:outer membrane protein assembly factor BamB
MKLALASFFALGSFLSAAPFGEQISESGIKHSFLMTGTKTAIIGEDSEIIWEIPKKSRDGEVLPNGNVLIAFAKEVKEFTKEKKVVFHYKLAGGNKEISTATRLANGNTLIAEMGAKPRLLEIAVDGKVVVEVPVKPETDNTHMQIRMARKLPNGNYLVPHLLAFAIKEYTPKGEVVRTIKTDLEELGGRPKKNWPFTAILLEDGKVMANLTNGNKTVIFDKDGKVVWKFEDARCADPCGGQFLGNGNVVACQYGQGKEGMPDALEINPAGKVVWEFKAPKFRGLHEIHVLTTNGKPSGGSR